MTRGLAAVTFVFLIALLAGNASGATPGANQGITASPAAGALSIPSSIREEHQHLHHQLELAMASGGKTAVRAKAVADVLLPHFAAEEEYAMPPLGLLTAIAQGDHINAAEASRAIEMAARLKAHYGQMIAEHQQIHAALEALAAAARDEHKQQVAAFAEALMLHAQNEEQVLYPATLLVGKYLTLQQAASGRRSK